MAYAEKYYSQVYDAVNGVQHRISLYADGFGGAATELDATHPGFEYEVGNPNGELWDVFLVGVLKWYIAIEDATDANILSDIAGAQVGTYRLEWRQAGTLKFRGDVHPNISDFGVGPYPFTATVKASDGITSLKGEDYSSPVNATSSFRKSVQTIVEDQLDAVGYGFGKVYADALDYRTAATGWNTNIIRDIHPDIRQLAFIPDDPSEPLEAVNRRQVLAWIQTEFNLRLLQWEEDWHFIQPDSYINASADFQDEATSSISDPYSTIDLDTSTVTLVHEQVASKNYHALAKKAYILYSHKTSKIQFDIDPFDDTASPQSDTLSEITTVGTEFVTLNAHCENVSGDDVTIGVKLTFDDGTTPLYWRKAFNDWSSVETTNDYENTTGLGFDVIVNTDTMPAKDQADLTLEISITTTGSANLGPITAYLNDTGEAPSKATSIQGTQDIAAVGEIDLQDVPIGYGPFNAARANLQDGSNNIVTDFRRAGEVAGREPHRQLLKTILSHFGGERAIYRFNRIKGYIAPTSAITFDAKTLIPVYVKIDGSGHTSGVYHEIAYTDNTVTFSTRTDEPVSPSPGTGTSSGGGTVTNALDDLTDVTLSSPSTDQFLTYDGSNWINLDLDATFFDVTATPELSLKLTDAEFTQLQNINSVTISNTQWGYVGALDQALGTGESVQFSQLGIGKTPSVALDVDGKGAFSDTITVSKSFGTLENEFKNTVSAYFSLLQLSGDQGGRGGYIVHYNSGHATQANEFSIKNTDGEINFFPGGSQKLTLTSTYAEFVDNVGIGVTPSSYTLELKNQFELANTGFTKGWTGDGGSGGYLGYDSAFTEYFLEVDRMRVRGGLFASEFVIDQTTSIGGDYIMSPANGKVDSVSGSAGSETIVMADPQNNNATSFAANDMLLIKQVNPDKSTVIKQIYREVSSVSNNEVTVTTLSGAPADSGSIAAGDECVAIGNTSNSDRQGIIWFSTTESGAPFQRFRIIASYADWNGTDFTMLLDGANQLIAINDDTFGNAGIQLDYNGGTSRAYIGDGANEFLKYASSQVEISAANGSVTLDGFGITLEAGSGTVNSLVWDDGATTIGQIAAYDSGGSVKGLFLDTADWITLDPVDRVDVKSPLYVEGNIYAENNAIFGGAAEGIINLKTLELSDNEKAAFLNDDDISALAFVVNDNFGVQAMVATRAGANSTAIMNQNPAGQFTTTEGNSGTVNIYWDATNARFEIENDLGGTGTFFVMYITT